jgi:hypothetical protein
VRRGTASRLIEEAEGYRSRIVAQAEGDSQRFRSVLAEYQKAPQVTRERMYTDAMRDIYANVTKVLVDSKPGSNLLYLPLDKIMAVHRVWRCRRGAAPMTGNHGHRARCASPEPQRRQRRRPFA